MSIFFVVVGDIGFLLVFFTVSVCWRIGWLVVVVILCLLSSIIAFSFLSQTIFTQCTIIFHSILFVCLLAMPIHKAQTTYNTTKDLFSKHIKLAFFLIFLFCTNTTSTSTQTSINSTTIAIIIFVLSSIPAG